MLPCPPPGREQNGTIAARELLHNLHRRAPADRGMRRRLVRLDERRLPILPRRLRSLLDGWCGDGYCNSGETCGPPVLTTAAPASATEPTDSGTAAAAMV